MVVPSEVCRKAVDVRLAFVLLGAGFERGVVDADVLAFRIEFGEGLVEAASSVTPRNFLQQRRCIRQMLTEGVGEGARTRSEERRVGKECRSQGGLPRCQ